MKEITVSNSCLIMNRYFIAGLELLKIAGVARLVVKPTCLVADAVGLLLFSRGIISQLVLLVLLPFDLLFELKDSG